VGTSEDCLVLNVWSPDLSGSAPVMVWFHGGGYAVGTASSPLYEGTNLAGRNDIVMVSVNHRLGLLGFLDVSRRLGEGHEGSANAGMLDLVAALEWVRNNIAAFGGDPSCVTIFGESGGGGKASPLLDLPAERLLEVQIALGAGGGPSPGGMSFAPTVGTDALPDWPGHSVRSRCRWRARRSPLPGPVSRTVELRDPADGRVRGVPRPVAASRRRQGSGWDRSDVRQPAHHAIHTRRRGVRAAGARDERPLGGFRPHGPGPTSTRPWSRVFG
jgi:hypothetical protein